MSPPETNRDLRLNTVGIVIFMTLGVDCIHFVGTTKKCFRRRKLIHKVGALTIELTSDLKSYTLQRIC